MATMLARCTLALTLLMLLLCGCQAPAPSPPVPTAKSQTAFPRDDLGRDIALKAPAKRVVVIGPGAIETVFALGKGPCIVGRDSFADYPPAARRIAVAGDYKGPTVEPCVALRPDLVIVQGETWDKARIESWQNQIGAPVAALVAADLQGVRRNFRQIGRWLGCDAAGISKLVATLPTVFPSSKHTAFVEIGRSPLYAAGEGTLVGDVLRAGGLRNAVTVRGYQPFGIESLLAVQPDFYVVPSPSPPSQIVRELRASPTLSKLKCIQAGHVIVLNGDLLLRPGPRLSQGIQFLRRVTR